MESQIQQIQNIKQKIKEFGMQQYHSKQIFDKTSKQISKLSADITNLQHAAEIIKQAAKLTQTQVKYAISEAGTYMLKSIFDIPPKIDVDFDIKHNQTVCYVRFDKNGELFHPMQESGFGEANIAGYGLQVAVWGLPAKKSRRTLVMDEPFMNLKGADANEKAIRAVKKISEELKMQVIMISDERTDMELIKKHADRVFRVIKATPDKLTHYVMEK